MDITALEQAFYKHLIADDLSSIQSLIRQYPILWSSCQYGFAPDPQKLTLLMIAAQHGAARCLEWLLEQGIPVDSPELIAQSALGFACEHGHTSCVQALLKSQAPLTYRPPSGHQPLILAAAGGHFDSLKLMLMAGAYVDTMDHVGMTALMHAALAGSESCTFLLLKSGADPFHIDFYQRSLLDMPRIRQHFKLFSLLQDYIGSLLESNRLQTVLLSSSLLPTRRL